MESANTTEQISGEKILRRNKVHHILVHSYTMYFVLFLIGVALDVIFRFQIFSSLVFTWIGVIFLIFSTFLIIWAQKTSRHLKKENMSKETFRQGPYRYTRNPTHLGLVMLIFGFGIIANAIFIILTTLISFLINKFVFLKKEESVLAEKFGAPYLEYKKSVKF